MVRMEAGTLIFVVPFAPGKSALMSVLPLALFVPLTRSRRVWWLRCNDDAMRGRLLAEEALRSSEGGMLLFVARGTTVTAVSSSLSSSSLSSRFSRYHSPCASFFILPAAAAGAADAEAAAAAERFAVVAAAVVDPSVRFAPMPPPRPTFRCDRRGWNAVFLRASVPNGVLLVVVIVLFELAGRVVRMLLLDNPAFVTVPTSFFAPPSPAAAAPPPPSLSRTLTISHSH
mmetsp:Transcript_33439/g.70292  ORF Transcript_33439/g.70292 Transcript_33439/m.70292 type:complete len:229 (+) Transcript_33439:2147-2833(+)